ncbi:uncharacterized protein AMSG_09995 [Thecamonas trahens ATCC 50062]|uniref:RNA helicase n=1 Tax=Thecamonas trahens ATCC 50062 TaxID=461836 RepID=A0A0L0DPM1_THETB|nr:hypothetical protein AMSG_09995 [Thecamonas trahens ATCC 50062]KNC54205.1 hypothetical protein AMSG_09995 [Thecamonas trahens ATCC 50062]|eukprot:XP_013753845.1 hypothetical protein AMSG_09995 [Thecamonas trahens ATCC 50062]
MASSALKTFVSDSLFKLLGFSEAYLEEYVAALAAAAKSKPELERKISACELPPGPATAAFVDALWAQMQGGSQTGGAVASGTRTVHAGVDALGRVTTAAVADAVRANESVSRTLVEKNKSYGFLLADDDDDEPVARAEPRARRKRKRRRSPSTGSSGFKSSSRRKRRSQRRHTRTVVSGVAAESGGGGGSSSSSSSGSGGSSSSSGSSSAASEPTAKRAHGLVGSGGDKYDADAAEAAHEAALAAKEAARAQDEAERDALAERIRQRDEARTRKIGEAAAAAQRREEAERRRKMDADERRKLLDELRKISRRSYLEMREDRQLDELEASLRDEEMMFSKGELTADELAEYEIKKQLLELAKRKKALEAATLSYVMPKAYVTDEGKVDLKSKAELLKARYVEPSEAAGKVTSKDGFSEQQAWEELQIAKAAAAGGNGGPGAPRGTEKKYELLVEEEDYIEFVVDAGDARLAGEGEVPEPPSAAETHAKAHASLQEVRRSLPVYKFRDAFLDAVDKHKVVVLTGETGSGKTTQLPQYLHEHGYTRGGKMIGCTQPRRVAAMSVAARVAEEAGVTLGREVGYSIRFEDCTSDATVIKYMTDGMLLREFMSSPDLGAYSVMIIDEAHERTLGTDILFGLIKDIARYRDDIRIVIASATLDAEKFSDYFDMAPIFAIPGRRYPVDLYYTKAPEADYLDAAVMTVLQIHKSQPAGDVLVFLTGQAEIETAQAALEERGRSAGSTMGELIIAPIYANLPAELQANIFAPTPKGARKVVLATNIAETSVTIDGIRYVVDPGFCKQKSFNPRSGMESLVVTPVSQAGARQRAGRAGRVAPGKCFRLFTAWAFENELEPNNIPEIQRTNLGNVVLMLKSLGIDDLIHFDFMDPPPVEAITKALEQLYALGALNDRGQLTKLGRRMAEFPLDPQLAKAIIAGAEYGVVSELVTIAAMLSSGNAVFFRPKDKILHADAAHKAFHKDGGDHLMLLAVYNEWAAAGYSKNWCKESFVQYRTMCRARDIRDQLLHLLDRVEIPLNEVETGDEVAIRKAVTAGFFFNTARLSRTGGSYKTVKHQLGVSIHPQSCLNEKLPRWVVYFELVFTSREFMRQVIEIDPGWLTQVAPHYYKPSDVAEGERAARKMPNAKARARAQA